MALTYFTDEETKVQRGGVTIMRSPSQIRGRADTNLGLLTQARCMTFPATSHLISRGDTKPVRGQGPPIYGMCMCVWGGEEWWRGGR